MNKDFSPQESLQIIEGMINKAQNKFAENGFLYLLWGWVILFCSLVQYASLKFNVPFLKYANFVWLLTIPTTVYQIIYLIKKKNTQQTVTYTDELIKYSWIVYGISMTLISFIIGKSEIWDKAYAIIFVIYGIPTFLCGVIMNFKPLKIGAICCWIIAIVATFVSTIDNLLLLALAMITTWIIPGYFLKAKYKKEHH